jgi:hypothetical protein
MISAPFQEGPLAAYDYKAEGRGTTKARVVSSAVLRIAGAIKRLKTGIAR